MMNRRDWFTFVLVIVVAMGSIALVTLYQVASVRLETLEPLESVEPPRVVVFPDLSKPLPCAPEVDPMGQPYEFSLSMSEPVEIPVEIHLMPFYDPDNDKYMVLEFESPEATVEWLERVMEVPQPVASE